MIANLSGRAMSVRDRYGVQHEIPQNNLLDDLGYVRGLTYKEWLGIIHGIFGLPPLEGDLSLKFEGARGDV